MLKPCIVPKVAFEVLKEAEQDYLEHQRLSDGFLTQLHSLFGNTLSLATELLEKCKIVEYQTADKCRSIYKIGCKLERYTIYKDINFCRCPAFKSQVLEDGTAITCKHVLAIKLNDITKSVKVQTESVTDSQFVEFLNEQLSYIND